MKFKIDENLPIELAPLLEEAGHDAATVHDQGVEGIADAGLISLCCQEGRVLVTLDLGFGDIRSYPPATHPGRVVFRLDRQDKPNMVGLCQRLIATLDEEDLDGSLWIVEDKRVRIRQSSDPS